MSSRLGLGALGVLLPLFLFVHGCGSSGGTGFGAGDGNGSGSSSGGGFGGDDGGAGSDDASISSDDGGFGGFGAADVSAPDSGVAYGTFTTPDCHGCTFPSATAAACPSAPAIKLVYPADGVLVPPNMNVISVMWTPFGAPFTTFEIDFKNQVTDTRVITKCAAQTQDTGQPNQPSGGCEVALTPAVWTLLSGANRGGFPVNISVRGTTDGTCASTSANSVNLSFAEEDVLGVIYYWKSTVSASGTGGQIWSKSFGDSKPEQQVTGTGGALSSTCNGCHALSRDGLRMTVYSDDDDSDDEYSDVTGSLIDMTSLSAIGTAYAGRGSGQPPGFSTFSPDHTHYVTSNGLGRSPTNVFSLWDGNAGTQGTGPTFGNAADRPTMPDWSPDGKQLIYVLPNKVASWDGSGFIAGLGRSDDDHEFGGSLYTIPYTGNGQFGTPTAFLQSQGENNYYPSYSPDNGFVLFDRAAQDKSVSAIDGCNTTPHPMCPNDSFSNPNARVMLTENLKGAQVIDLQKANGSPAASPAPLSNSWPRWSPFVQSYRGNRLLWITFSSTRDYGVRVRNHKPGMYQCYPPDSYEIPGGAHGSTFDPLCQQPQLWMAPINLSEASGADPSFPAFWIPFQDITTHNHTPQWTQAAATPPPPPASCVPQGGNCQTNPAACCAGTSCNGSGTCGQVVQ
jgi:hypothetical protein